MLFQLGSRSQLVRYGLCSFVSVLITFMLVSHDVNVIYHSQQQASAAGNQNLGINDLPSTDALLRDIPKIPDSSEVGRKEEADNDTDSGLIDWDKSNVKPVKKLPNALIIGARKAGTTTLLEFLTINRYIRVCHGELAFFSKRSEYEKGLSYYSNRMPETYPGQVTLEKTPEYFTSPEAPQRVFQMNSAIKLILILRNPIERLMSDYAHNKYMGRIETVKSFENLVLNENGTINTEYRPVPRGIYHLLLERWLSYFPRDQFLILDGEKLVQDPVPVLNEVEEFLGVPIRIQQRHVVYNQAKGFYCRVYHKQMSCMGKNKGLDHPDVPADVRKKIKNFYKPYNDKLFKLIGRTFSWK